MDSQQSTQSLSAEHKAPIRNEPNDRGSASVMASRLVVAIGRHWLALINSAVAVYLLLPFVAPILANAGITGPANVIYGMYSFACHQLPDHSYFFFGEQPLYSLRALEASGVQEGLNLFQLRQIVGNEVLGYKVAICQRDVAIYSSVLGAGLLFGLVRNRVRSPGWKLYLLFLIPIALDGFTQMFGWRESNWWLRTLTGALFGAASVWLAYPYLEEAMTDVVESEEARLPS